MEIIDLYDKDKNPLNKTAVRGEPRNDGEYHFVIHICIFNAKGEMLIQQRNTEKSLWPGLWDVSCSGVPISGETTQEGARRELKEELDLDYDFSDTRPMVTTPFELGFSDYFLVEFDVALEDVHLKSDEVQNIKWANLSEIREKLSNKRFVPYVDHFIDLLFTMYEVKTEIEP